MDKWLHGSQEDDAPSEEMWMELSKVLTYLCSFTLSPAILDLKLESVFSLLRCSMCQFMGDLTVLIHIGLREMGRSCLEFILYFDMILQYSFLNEIKPSLTGFLDR